MNWEELTEAQLPIVLYGMGEKSIVEVAEALDSGLPIDQVTWICGSVCKLSLIHI